MTFLWTETLTPLAYQLRRWHTSGHASGHAHSQCPMSDGGQVDYLAKCSLASQVLVQLTCLCLPTFNGR